MNYAMTLPQTKINNGFRYCGYMTNTTTKSNVLYIEKITEKVSFKRTIVLKPDKLDGLFVLSYSCGPLELDFCETSRRSLKEAFEDEILHLWRYYAKESDNNLTKRALEIKKWLLFNIREEQ